MIKQDYLIRMIQEIVSFIINTILRKNEFIRRDWSIYDHLIKEILGFPTESLININVQELIDKYEKDSDRIDKIELAAMTILKISYEMDNDILLKSKLQQNGIILLKYVDKECNIFSIQRAQLISQLENNC